MTKKHIKSKDMQNHKRPMETDVLQEEFGHETGDMNAAKLFETMVGNKKSDKKKDK